MLSWHGFSPTFSIEPRVETLESIEPRTTPVVQSFEGFHCYSLGVLVRCCNRLVVLLVQILENTCLFLCPSFTPSSLPPQAHSLLTHPGRAHPQQGPLLTHLRCLIRTPSMQLKCVENLKKNADEDATVDTPATGYTLERALASLVLGTHCHHNHWRI